MGLSLENIRCTLSGDEILHGISFEVETGEFISLLGASGAGKSTTLKIIAGLLEQSEGHVIINEKVADNLPAYKRNVAIVFQDIRLFPNMTVEENIAFAMKMKHTPKAARSKRVEELLELVQLSGLGKRRIDEISGGQQQRVALARALAADPAIVLLDEPFSGLDEELRADMRQLVMEVQQKTNMTTLQVTHDATEALMMSDRIIYLTDGTIAQIGTPTELFEHPKTLEVATCTGNCATIQGQIKDGAFIAGDLHIATNTPDGPAVAVIRHNSLKTVPGTAFVAQSSQYRGQGYLTRATLSDTSLGEQTIHIPTNQLFEPGATFSIQFDPKEAFVFSQKAGC